MTYNAPLVADMIATGEPASREFNDRLFPRVVAGDAAAVQQMIEGNMSLVVSKVDSFIRELPNVSHLRDDLIAEGFLGLTIAVQRMATETPPPKPNPTGYMSVWIRKHIGIVADGEYATGAAVSTIQDRRTKGVDTPHTVPMPPDFDEISVDPMAVVDLRDIIESACEDDTDRRIVELREGSHSYAEIAAILELPLTTIYMAHRDIYARFLKLSGLKGEA